MSSRRLSSQFLRLLAVVSFGAPACGSTPKEPGGQLPPILVAGSYTGTRTWVENSCGPNTTLNPLAITVTHTRGSASATINDGVASFPGTLMGDGRYAIVPVAATLGDGTPFTMTLSGAFTRTTLELRQAVTENRAAGSCQYVIDWKTTKVGAPNDIP